MGLHVSRGFTRIFFHSRYEWGLRVSRGFTRIFFHFHYEWGSTYRADFHVSDYTCDTSDTWRLFLELSPDHLVDYAYVGLDDADYFGADVLVYVVGYGDAGVAVTD